MRKRRNSKVGVSGYVPAFSVCELLTGFCPRPTALQALIQSKRFFACKKIILIERNSFLACIFCLLFSVFDINSEP